MLTGFGKIHLLVVLAVLFAVTFGYGTQANAQNFSVGFSNREFTGKSGETFQSTISVSNTSDTKGEFSATLREFEQPDNTVEPHAKARSLCSSITLSPSQLTLDAGESGTILFQVKIPDDQTLEGSYWGSIVINKVSTEDEILANVGSQTEDSKLGVGIKLLWEYQIGVYATIEGTEIREATFSEIRTETKNGSPNITATFNNLGNIHLRPQIWLEVTAVTGEVVYKSETMESVFFPSRRPEISFPLIPARLGSGEYMVMVIADYGMPQMIAAQARVSVSEEMAAAMAKAMAEAERVEAAADAAASEAEANGGAGEGEGGGETETGGAGEGEPEGA